MASLTGTKIRDTYDALLKVSDNGALDGTLQTITDGLGNNSSLSLSTAGASVTGTLAVSGATTLSGGSLTVKTTTERANITTDANLVSENGIGVVATSTTYGQGYQYVRFMNSAGSYSGSISHTASTGIGLYSGSDLILASSSTERMRIDSSGNVGIGTTNGDIFGRFYTRSVGIDSSGVTKIQIDGASYSGIDFGVNGTRSGEINNAGSFEISTLDARAITLTTNGSERMRIDSSGNVGIGTSTVNSKFVVINNAAPNASGNITSGAQFAASTANASLNIGSYDDGSSNRYGYLRTAFADNAAVAADLRIYTGATERMRIDSSGNVGIGVSPSAWTSITKVLQIGNRASVFSYNNLTTDIGNNIYFGGGDYRYIATAAASFYRQNGAEHAWYRAASGNAGDGISFIQSMFLSNSGYLKASEDGSYVNATGSYHELKNSTNDNYIAIFSNNGTPSPYGISIAFNQAAPNNTGNTFINAGDISATRFIVYSNGNVANLNNSYGAISDAKRKENIVDASPKLEDLMQVRVRNYNLIGDDKKQLGVVAQELEKVFPSMIDESPDYEEREVEVRDEEGNIVYKTEKVLVSEEVLDEEGNVIEEAVYETIVTDEPEMTTERVDLGTVTKSVKYSVFVPMLIKAIQEQQEIINDLKARIETLENA